MDNRDIRYDSNIKIADTLSGQIKRISLSAFQLVTAFIFSNLALRGTTGLVAKLLGYGVGVTYNGVAITPGDFHLWELWPVIVVHLFPAIICLGLGIVVFGILTAIETVNRARVFLFWLATCLVNVCFAQLFFSPLGAGGESTEFYQTFSIFGTYIGMSTVGMIVFTIIAVIASLVWGSKVCDEVLKFSFSAQILRTRKGKNVVVWQVYIIPVLFCIPALILLHSSAKVYHGSNIFPSLITILNLLIISIGMFIRNNVDFAILEFECADVLNRIPLPEFIIAAAIWVAVFIWLR